ncbi:MAG TPA: hypothetical protein VMZ03_01045 [Chitinophagaceae bacterium]|nr:hypothetical protein [Chitinophagaceae bacterium]
MRKFLLIAFSFYFFSQPALASTVPSTAHHYTIIPTLRVKEFLELSARDLEKLTGEKMNLVTRLSYGILRGKMRKAMKKDPSITVNEFMSAHKKMKTWLVVLLIVLGAILVFFIIFALAYGGAF